MILPTVVRVRGEVSVMPTVTNTGVKIGFAYGLAVVSDEAFAAGAASIPGPFRDAAWGGWFVWGAGRFEWVVGTNVGILGQSANWSREVDSKAMRKIGTNETIVFMVESQIGALDISMHLRLLFLLS